MPRGDKPTTVALALKDGWVYEDALPAMSKEEYDWWYKESLVLDGVRMGPPWPNPTPTQQETLREEAVQLCLAMGLPDNHACIRLAENYLNSRAAVTGPRNTAQTARNSDEAQDIIMSSEEALGQCYDAATRHDLASRITEALAAATAFPTPADVVKAVSHWCLKAGVEETMCGLATKGLLAMTLISDWATCEKCKIAAFGYQMGRADERANSTPPERTRVAGEQETK